MWTAGFDRIESEVDEWYHDKLGQKWCLMAMCRLWNLWQLRTSSDVFGSWEILTLEGQRLFHVAPFVQFGNFIDIYLFKESKKTRRCFSSPRPLIYFLIWCFFLYKLLKYSGVLTKESDVGDNFAAQPKNLLWKGSLLWVDAWRVYWLPSREDLGWEEGKNLPSA